MARLKFGDSLVIRQTAKLKLLPNKPRIRYIHNKVQGIFYKFIATYYQRLGEYVC